MKLCRYSSTLPTSVLSCAEPLLQQPPPLTDGEILLFLQTILEPIALPEYITRYTGDWCFTLGCEIWSVGVASVSSHVHRTQNIEVVEVKQRFLFFHEWIDDKMCFRLESQVQNRRIHGAAR